MTVSDESYNKAVNRATYYHMKLDEANAKLKKINDVLNLDETSEILVTLITEIMDDE